jgi:hypothetical protein
VVGGWYHLAAARGRDCEVPPGHPRLSFVTELPPLLVTQLKTGGCYPDRPNRRSDWDQARPQAHARANPWKQGRKLYQHPPCRIGIAVPLKTHLAEHGKGAAVTWPSFRGA